MSADSMNADFAYEHNGKRIARGRFYEVACDPRRSVAVEACAGAGKTWMLVSRMLRALLAGSEPQEILAITFTKKAAGEMRERLQQWLAEFAHCADDKLRAALVERGVASPKPEEIEALRGLHARMLARGRPVQIRTFHSWFAALLRNAPLAVLEELRLPAHYELLEDDSEAVALVWRRFHGRVAAAADARRDFEASVAAHGRFNTQKALAAALARRVEFALADAQGVVEASVAHFTSQTADYAAFDDPTDSLATEGARQRWQARAAALGREKNKTPQKAAALVIDAFEQPDLDRRFALLRQAFFVANEDRLTKNLQAFPAAQEAAAELEVLCAARLQHEGWLHHGRITRLARVLVDEFAALKRDHGWVDMNDVEQAALRLLADPVLSGWVQERLDARTRHLLIDEFQDTNPLQWQALHAWLQSYAGAGGQRPSVFIVGDPKQSIYRFRRAEPQVFRAAKSFIADGLDGDVLSCDHTHRNAPEVIAVVNTVMAAAQAAGEYEGFREHTTESLRAGWAGALPPIERAPRAAADAGDEDDGPAWRDSLITPRETPEEKLITLECRQAARWIAAQVAQGIAPADIMVLARKRDRLAALDAELRALHIAADQPEKTDLREAPEVQDIVALLDVLVSPTHDLSLARALKSPLFGMGDEVLVELALQAREARTTQPSTTWFELLQRRAEEDSAIGGVARQVAAWQKLVDTLPPHDALDAIYAQGDVLARFGAAAPAPLRAMVLARLRALLLAALQVDGGRYATPYAFVRALKAGGIKAPATAQPQAVRLLTVHGAKGLQAPVVLLLDTDAAAPRAETMTALVDWPGESDAPVRFAFIASETKPPPSCRVVVEAEHAARHRESLNMLYVALTRAQNGLVISAVQPPGENAGSWWQRLAPLCMPIEAPSAPSVEGGAAAQTFTLKELPALTASAAPVAAKDADSDIARFGRAVHSLLEHWQPGSGDFATHRIERIAREFGIAPARAQDAARMARDILQGDGAWAWDPAHVDWHANEVPLHDGGEMLRIDRLVRRAGSGEWWVLDYKSAWQPQQQEELLAQMRRYRRAVGAAYPGSQVRAAFLTGQGKVVVVAE